MFQGKKILLGITGSIAAYKAILLVRLLVQKGAEVKVLLTPAALDFVPILTLSTLSKNKVVYKLSDEDTWSNHVMLGRWADVMVIAPASCNTLAKMASGITDNLLLAAYFSATCPVVIAPAMDEDMWLHTATQRNLETLRSFGNRIVPVNSGELASGLFGEGRMAEPADILIFLAEQVFRRNTLNGLKALVTAGPTYEAIDPVRFIGNHSSGKMGIALAEALFEAGANVQLVLGPSSLRPSYGGIDLIRVTTASQMLQVCLSLFADTNITIMAAAVADYMPETIYAEKIKKSDDNFRLNLVKTPDILHTLGLKKTDKQFLAGFALETQNEEDNALAKMRRKKLDLIVLNSLNDPLAGFAKDTNQVTIFNKNGSKHHLAAKSKKLIAAEIIDVIIRQVHDQA